MISIRPRQLDVPDRADLPADDLLAALREVARERDATTALRDRLAADLARRETEQRAALARTRRAWGPGFDVAVPTGDRHGERLRADLAAAAARLPAIAAWRGEVGSAHETENIVRQGLANGRKGRNLPRSTCLRCRQA